MAVKVVCDGGVSPAMLTDKQIAAINSAFRKELSILARASASSARVCALKGYVFAPAGPGIVMQLYAKGSLRDVLAAYQGAGLPWPMFLSFARDMAEGVRDMHAVSIVLRDLKPENCLVDGDDRLYLSDFGISRVVEETAGLRTRQIGTHIYMAPESFESELVSSECDVWALGCCLVHLFSGQRPWHHVDRKAFYRLVQTQHPLIPAAMPARLRSLVKQCFARNPKRRPTADECYSAICSLGASDEGEAGDEEAGDESDDSSL